MKEELKELSKIKENLKNALSFLEKEEGELIKKWGEPNFELKEVPLNITEENLQFELKKYILKGNEKYGFIPPSDLEPGKLLHNDLQSLIHSSLGSEFVNVLFHNTLDRYRQPEETILFSQLFQKIFTQSLKGNIRPKQADKCDTFLSCDTSENLDRKITIGVNLCYRDNLKYYGDSFEGKNVLLFGLNIEENELVKTLFNKHKPKIILNIIPLGDTQTFYDNVD